MLDLDCTVGEGGGGILRAALPLSLFTGTPVRFSGFRAGRREVGLGWPHMWLLNAYCAWTASTTERAVLGSTDFTFTPGVIDPTRGTRLDFDDPGCTILQPTIRVDRAYEESVDRFLQPMNNVDGKCVRGHSIITPLLAMLPVLLWSRRDIAVEARGGTETPGAPFVDALQDVYVRALNERYGGTLSLDVAARGCIGQGGGQVFIRTRGGASARSVDDVPGRIDLSVSLYIFGEPADFESLVASYDGHVARLARAVGVEIRVRKFFIPYPVSKYQQLFVIRRGSKVRDVSVCFEEIPVADRGSFGWETAVTRLRAELECAPLTSRFLAEMFLITDSVAPAGGSFCTERLTPHAAAVLHVAAELTGRRAFVEGTAPGPITITIPGR